MYYVGVDLGGTNIAAGVVTESGELIHQDSCPTGVGRPYEQIISDMGELVNKVIRDSGCTVKDMKAVGIGSPGAADCKAGEIVFANNLSWYHVPICAELKKHVGPPVFVDNDANVAALAETVAGCAKGRSDVILLTLGTGVGGGIVLNGRILGGVHHVGAEIGHMIVEVQGEQCSCGNRGCFERYTSATALIREGRKCIIAHPDSRITLKTGGDLDKVTAKIVLDSAKEGDIFALEIFERFIHYLAMGIVSLINLFDPEVIAIGGGVAKAGDFLMEALLPEVKKHIFYKDLPYADIMLSPMGNEAGIIGAAMMGAGNL